MKLKKLHYNEIQEINILEFILNNLSNLIVSTLDGCIVNKKDEMLNIYADYMNNMYLTICQIIGIKIMIKFLMPIL